MFAKLFQLVRNYILFLWQREIQRGLEKAEQCRVNTSKIPVGSVILFNTIAVRNSGTGGLNKVDLQEI